MISDSATDSQLRIKSEKYQDALLKSKLQIIVTIVAPDTDCPSLHLDTDVLLDSFFTTKIAKMIAKIEIYCW